MSFGIPLCIRGKSRPYLFRVPDLAKRQSTREKKWRASIYRHPALRTSTLAAIVDAREELGGRADEEKTIQLEYTDEFYCFCGLRKEAQVTIVRTGVHWISERPYNFCEGDTHNARKCLQLPRTGLELLGESLRMSRKSRTRGGVRRGTTRNS